MIDVMKRDGFARICILSGGGIRTPLIFLPRGEDLPPFLTEAAGGLVLEDVLPSDEFTSTDLEPVEHVLDETSIMILRNLQPMLHDVRRFAESVLKARRNAGPEVLIHAPGVATPHTLPLLVYMGIDLLDALLVLQESLHNRYYTHSGVYAVPPDECLCGHDLSTKEGLFLHNLTVMLQTLQEVRQAIASGRLRDLVEFRAPATDFGSRLLTILDMDHTDLFESTAPVWRSSVVTARTDLALRRPEVRRFQRRVIERYDPSSSEVLLLLPCSARKPYSRSRSHAHFRDAIRKAGASHAIQEMIVTSPLGLVPREIETVYPAAHYETPVTGHWSSAEKDLVVSMLDAFLRKRRYKTVIAHLPPEMGFIEEHFDVVWTVRERPTSREDLRSLTDALAGLDLRFNHEWREDWINAISSFQFGCNPFDRFTVKGRLPYVDVMGVDKCRLASVSKEKGHLVLTLKGADRLLESGIHWVEIGDFTPAGSVLAPGVLNAHHVIRPGDEVVVHHEGEVRAVGTAVMSAYEMIRSMRGVAVKVRSHKRDG